MKTKLPNHNSLEDIDYDFKILLGSIKEEPAIKKK